MGFFGARGDPSRQPATMAGGAPEHRGISASAPGEPPAAVVATVDAERPFTPLSSGIEAVRLGEPRSGAAQLAAHGSAVVAAVIPCYRARRHVGGVIRSIPDDIRYVIVVDDACPEGSGDEAEAACDPRVVVVRHPRNRGVGGAMKSGFIRAMELGADYVVKIDGDGQMDPARAASLISPLVARSAAFTKGNRFFYLKALARMPTIRRIGNIGLSFLTKLASGYWELSDPTNGFIAIRTDVLECLELDALSDDYFFETSLLIELGKRGFRIKEVPMPAQYGEETSSLSITRALLGFPPRLLRGTVSRVLFRHFWFDFTPTAVTLSAGLPLVLWGVSFGAFAWMRSILSHEVASAGTVMLAALPFIVGVELLLHALSYEILSGFNQRVSGREE